MKDQDLNLNVKKVDRVSSTLIRLTLEYAAETIKQEEKKTANQYVQSAKIPGFRPGKAPLNMVRSKYKDEIQKDLVSKLVEKGLIKALDETKFTPISRPQVKFDQAPTPEAESFEFQAEFEIQPEIELRHYKGIPLRATETEAKDEEIENALNNIRERMAVLEPVEQENAEKGLYGLVEIGFEVGEGEEKKVEEPKPATIEIGGEKLLPEIEKALLEMKVGETKAVPAKFPDDFNQKEYAGKSAVFHIKMVELKKKALPEADDALAAQLKEGNTLETLKQEIAENIIKSKEEENRRNQRKEIVDYLVANHTFDVPQVLVEQQSRSLIQWIYDDMKRKGVEQPPAMKEEELKEVQNRAEHMVRSSLLLREIATKEKITLDEEKVTEKVATIATQMKQSAEECQQFLNEKGLMEQFRDEILTDQVFEFLIKNSETVNGSPRSKN